MIKTVLTFWKEYFIDNPKRKYPLIMLFFIVSMEFFVVYLNVCFNTWRNGFYNSLQNVDKLAFLHSIYVFMGLALTFVGVIGYKNYLMQKLQIEWRLWKTQFYLDKWLDQQLYYGCQFLDGVDNINQRIGEDINSFIASSISLTLGVLSSITTFFSFIFILWELSSDTISFSLFNYSMSISHYLVWAVLLYSIFGTWVTKKIGRPLSNMRYQQELFEANLRSTLVRTTENSEKIALAKGEKWQKNLIINKFNKIYENFNIINKKQKHLTWWSSYFAQIAVVFPYLVSAPRYFAGTIKLGGLMQVASAFDSVQTSLGWIVDNYNNLASFKANTLRLKGFDDAGEHWASIKKNQRITVKDSDHIGFKHLQIKLPNEKIILNSQSFRLKQGDKCLIKGASGVGKSTILRAMSNIWPNAHGSILKPKQSVTMFLSQDTNIPEGSMIDVLSYPNNQSINFEILNNLLIIFDLQFITENLQETNNWDKILSNGQKQKIAIIRAILQKPDILFLDETTSSLDEMSEEIAIKTLFSYLDKSTIITVGHRETLNKFHNRKFFLYNSNLKEII